MLTFVNSKLPDDWQISDKQYHIFQKCKFFERLNTDIYIFEDLGFIIHIFYCYIQLDHEMHIKWKKTSNLIKVISSYNICSNQTMKSLLNVKKRSNLIKVKQAKKKNICHSVQKTFNFSQNFSVLFHQVTFDHSTSCVLLIDKPNESFKKI